MQDQERNAFVAAAQGLDQLARGRGAHPLSRHDRNIVSLGETDMLQQRRKALLFEEQDSAVVSPSGPEVSTDEVVSAADGSWRLSRAGPRPSAWPTARGRPGPESDGAGTPGNIRNVT
jgi:hypothetical protein